MEARPFTPSPQPWRGALQKGAARSRAFVWFLLKTLLPLYLATEVLKASGLLAWLAGYLAPLMGWWGLPGEAAAALCAGLFINLYAAAAVAAPLGLSWQQVSVLGLILGIAHSLLVETAVVRGLTPSYKMLTVLRVGLGLAAGWLLALVII
ncbi:MAG: nucleoside recognition protein [Desulfarculus sp.]|nr:nucleoside recognition protein [Desulfarculus sp.]